MSGVEPVEFRLIENNLYTYPHGKRRCRTCKRAQDRKQYAKKKLRDLAQVRSEARESFASAGGGQ